MNIQFDTSVDCHPVDAPAKPGVLIIGGAIGSLAAARSLGRLGARVWYLTDGYPLPGLSRYVARTLKWNGAHTSDAADELVALARRHGLEGWLLVPGGDPEIRLAARHYGQLSQVFRLTTPNWDTIQWADDKNLTYQMAERLGIDVPKRYRPASLDEVRRLDCQFPVILKPASHHERNAFTLAKAWVANDRATLIERYRQAAEAVPSGDIVLQEMIPGNGHAQFSYAAVWHDGRPLGALVALRTRQYPINVGYTSSFVETVDNPTIVEAATLFLSEIKYSGPVEVEFKFDARDGKYKILDVNPRIWAWVGIGDAAGIDFPALLYRATLDERVMPAPARPDAAWVYMSRDVAAAAHEMLIGRLSAGRYFSGYRKHLSYAVFATDDLLPFLAELPVTLYRAFKNRLMPLVSNWRMRF